MWSNPAGFEMATDELIQRIESPFEESLLEDLPPMETAALTSWLTKNSTWRKQIDIKPETLWLKDRRANPSMIGSQGHWGYIQRIEKLLKDERPARVSDEPDVHRWYCRHGDGSDALIIRTAGRNLHCLPAKTICARREQPAFCWRRFCFPLCSC